MRIKGVAAKFAAAPFYAHGHPSNRFSVDEISLVFGIHDLLVVVQAEVAGYHVAEGDGEQEIRHTGVSEQLEADQQGGDGTVGHAAENGGHAYRGAEGRREPKQTAKQAAEGGSRKKGGNDLTALKAGAEGSGGKDNLEQKSLGANRGLLHTASDEIHACAVVSLIPHQQREDDDDAAAYEDADKRIFEQLFIQMFRVVESDTEKDTD